MTNDVFAGKKVLVFEALAYHDRILSPVMRQLKERGATIEYFTAQAEAAFEITFKKNGLPFFHVNDFLSPSIIAQVNEAYTMLSKRWQKLLLRDENLQHVPVIILDKILRAAIEAHFGIGALMDDLKPDIVFSLHELNSWGVSTGYCAKARGLPFFTFQEGKCYSAIPMYRGHAYYSDACFLWGEADKSVLLAAGNDSAKLPIVGNIDLPPAIRESSTQERIADTRQKYDIKEGQKLILFLMGFATYAQLQSPAFIRFLWEHPEYVCVFKFHPIQGADIVRLSMSILGQIPSTRTVSGDASPYDLIAAAAACVLVGASTTGIEAMAFNKPLVEIPLVDSTYSYADQGAVPPAATIEDAAAISHKLISEGLTPEWKEKHESFLRLHFANYVGDGVFVDNAPEKVVSIVESVLTAK